MSKITISDLTESLNKDQIIDISSESLSVIQGGLTCIVVATEDAIIVACVD